MSMQSTGQGFTIIEVMLVLGVTGLMLVGVFIGANTQISMQRYKDSVTSLQADLQNEYSQVLNVANDRPYGAKCTLSSPANSSRGADAKCLVLGRLLQSTNGTTITSTPVIGVSNGQPNDPLTPANWTLSAAPTSDNTNTYTVKWGGTMKIPGLGVNPSQAFSALIVVSPSNGVIQTYVDPTNGTRSAANLLGMGAIGQKDLNLCVTNGFNIFSGNLLAVRVDRGASGAGSVEVPKQSDNVCQGIS